MATLETLYDALADIERQQEDKTLPHSDQQMLDQAWEDIKRQIDELDEVEAECYTCKKAMTKDDMESWACDDDAVDWRRPQCDGCRAMDRGWPPRTTEDILQLTPDGRWVPAPPLPIRPRAPVPFRVCNCDSDGECGYCEEERLAEEEQERVNALVDDREGCEYCHGCHYCQDPRYDGSDEI
jgi:hypothetical protein